MDTPLVAFITAAPDDIMAYWIKRYDLHLFYRLPVLCRRTREHFQLARRLALAEAIGANVRIYPNAYRDRQARVQWTIIGPSNEPKYRHSLFGPAITFADGSQEWYWLGVLHRGNDLPAVVAPHRLVWYHHGKRHCARVATHQHAPPAMIEWVYGKYAAVRAVGYHYGEFVYRREWNLPNDHAVDQRVAELAGVRLRE